MSSKGFVNRLEALHVLAEARIGRLATITPEGRPHIVPVTFALLDELIVTMVDHKPKTTRRLRRLRNIESDPRAGLLADQYSEDWGDLWWVRVDGIAELHGEGELWEASRDALAEKYGQYRGRRPEGTAIALSMEHVTWWSSTP